MANDILYRLASYFYTKNHTKVWRVAEALDYGMGGINTVPMSTKVAPFRGVKESGNSCESSKYGMIIYKSNICAWKVWMCNSCLLSFRFD